MAAAVPAVGLLLAAPLLHAQGAMPFAGYSGHWAGGGDITMTDGSKEKIRCKADYSSPPSGDALHININCASDSYKVNVISNIVAGPGGHLSGTWRELTRQAEGDVSGRIAGPGQIQASLQGTVYGIELSANTKGNQQAVAIRAQGTDVQAVNITLRRS
ncbi:MAG TPA: hypothetical protein VH414_17335 [Lichenihabitans sp.]|nr:hypothetical protein [Lichenihabitans sp.]